MRNRGMSLLELLVVLAILILFVAILLPAFANARGIPARHKCAANLKQLGLASTMFAREDPQGLYPTLYAAQTPFVNAEGATADHSDFLVMPSLDPSDLYPDYVIDPAAFVCPSLPDHSTFDGRFDAVADAHGRLLDDRGLGLAAKSYMYLGWALDRITPDDSHESLAILGSAQELTAPAQLVLGVGPVLDELKRTENPELAQMDIPVPGGLGTGGGTVIHRLREGIERFGVTDINNTAPAARAEAAIWVLADRVRAPQKGSKSGANVLFLDGHVEFVPYEAKAPVTRGMADFLDALQ